MTPLPASFQYVWLIWASAFLVPWAILFLVYRPQRRSMLWASALTAPFGLTEPLFVPAYWNPPSLFDLAQRTGFDIESLIFCFAISGIGVTAYRFFTRESLRQLAHDEREARRHRWHLLALASPVLVFGALVLLPWNPIYPAIIAMLAGASATVVCRPDLLRSTLIGGCIFLLIYGVFLFGLKWIWPGYVAAVWNTDSLIQWRPGDLPLEEFLFGFGFGTYWSSVYEHLTWHGRDEK